MKKRWMTITVKSSIKISCERPPVHKIVRMKATPAITRTSAILGKVIYRGHLIIEVEYAALTASGRIHAALFQIPITGFLPCKKARYGMAAAINAETEFISFELAKPRLISVFILVRLCIAQLHTSDVTSQSDVIDFGRDIAERSEADVFTGRIRRPTKINAWTRKQRY